MEARTTKSLCNVVRSTLATLILGLSARATDHYVDAVNGNNLNAGTSPATAWRTITYAISQLPVPSTGIVDVVHVAPGVYDAALGETFPILLADHDAVQIVGTAGSAATILDGGGGGALIIDNPHPFIGGHTGPLTLVQGLTLCNGSDGLVLTATRLKSTFLTCRDLRIQKMSGHAVTADTYGTMLSSIVLNVTLDRAEISSNQEGVHIQTNGGNSVGPIFVTIQDGAITHNRGTGIFVSDPFDAPGTQLAVSRSRVTDNGHDGIRIEQGSFSNLAGSAEITDSLIAKNMRDGVKIAGPQSGTYSHQATSILRCTIADNGGTGLDSAIAASTPPSFGFVTTLEGSILHGNGDDLNDNPAQLTIVTPTYCDIGDGDYAGANGNIAVDPLFRDPNSFDYRLVWGSPCIDSGDPTTPVDTLDLNRVKRPIDGNLDAQERGDMGALEFAPLWASPNVQLGGTLVIEQWGPAGGMATLLVARGQPLPAPQSTRFGEVDVDLDDVRNLGAGPVSPGSPTVRVIQIPNDPNYVDLTVTFQALANSTVGSPPLAYTNPVTVTVLP